jgi:nitrite reductase/ring-hydroxylating ferredoxin subunit
VVSRRGHVDAFLDAILKDRRPPRFPAEEEEAHEMLAAASLRAGQPGADAPRPEFVEQLERRLRSSIEADDPGAVRLSRRRLLGGAAVAAAAAVGAGIGIDRVIQRTGDTAVAPSGELVPARRGRWIDVAAADEVPVGRPLRFTAGAIEGFVVNHGDRFQAVSALCSHMPCTLHFNAGSQRLDCPCHGAWFGLDGVPLESKYPYALEPLPAVRTRVVAGRVQVFSV